MIKERFNYTSLSENINTGLPVFMLDCLQMHCSTKKGSLEPWAELCAGAEALAGGCSTQSHGDCSADEDSSYDHDMKGKSRAGFWMRRAVVEDGRWAVGEEDVQLFWNKKETLPEQQGWVNRIITRNLQKYYCNHGMAFVWAQRRRWRSQK